MFLRLPLLIFSLAMIAASGSCAPPSPANEAADSSGSDRASDMPMGRLGYPIGTYLTISGVRAEPREEPKVGSSTLIVDRVGGQDLDAPIRVRVRNVGPLPVKTRCTFRGYESGQWIGVPPEVLNATGAPGPQAVWQFALHFIVVIVDEPGSVRAQFSSPLDLPDP